MQVSVYWVRRMLVRWVWVWSSSRTGRLIDMSHSRKAWTELRMVVQNKTVIDPYLTVSVVHIHWCYAIGLYLCRNMKLLLQRFSECQCRCPYHNCSDSSSLHPQVNDAPAGWISNSIVIYLIERNDPSNSLRKALWLIVPWLIYHY